MFIPKNILMVVKNVKNPLCKSLKVQSCKLCNRKYMTASTQITKTEIFAFISVCL